MTVDPERRQLISAVDRLSGEVADLKESIDGMQTALTATSKRTEEVDQSAQSRSRSLRRRWIMPLLLAILVVAALATAGWYEQHQTSVHFEHVRQGLVEGCQAQQRSNSALRTKNKILLADARTRAETLAHATAPGGQAALLVLLRQSADADVQAYDGYLRAIPPPVNCQVRYGR